MFHKYNLDTPEGASAFDRDLNGVSWTFGFGFEAISVADAFQNYYGTDRQMYYMAVDLKLCLFNLFSTIRELEMLRARTSLYELFTFHNRWVHFVAVYRSFYDKFMNLTVKAGYPDEYKRFENSRSKLGMFKNIASKQSAMYLAQAQMFIQLPPDFVTWMHGFISVINDQYRTAEVHGSGQARKWVFSQDDLAKTPYSNIQDFVNHLGQFINLIGCILSGKAFADRLQRASEAK